MQRWQRLGKIYNPGSLSGLNFSHGLMPVPEHLSGDTYRVYFAGRDREKRSNICAFVFDIKNKTILDYTREALLEPGFAGMFDDSGCVPSFIEVLPGKRYLYYVGWNIGGRVPFRLSLGLAVSEGEAAFTRYSNGPIADRSFTDPCLVGSCGILRESQLWRMWYVSGVDWIPYNGDLRHRYHLKYAESSDGINWRRDGKVAIHFRDDQEYAFASPRVIKDGQRYRMWYCYRGDVYRIGYAESADGLDWERLDHLVEFRGADEDWERQMRCYPYIFEHEKQMYMLYNGNGFGETGIGLAVMAED